MSKAKLTLSVDDGVVERAKTFAEQHDTSVSSLVEGFLRRLAAAGDRSPLALPPIVARLRGLGRPSGGGEEYRRHLEEKYGQ